MVRVFNLLSTGLGNNGGSKTLIRSAETLQELGEEVYWADTSGKVITNAQLNDTVLMIYNGSDSTYNF